MPWSQPWYVVRRVVGGSLLYTRTTELSVWGRAFVPCVLLQALLLPLQWWKAASLERANEPRFCIRHIVCRTVGCLPSEI